MKTFTVQQLIEHLKTYPPDLPIFNTWEGLILSVDASNFEQTLAGEFCNDPARFLGLAPDAVVVAFDAEAGERA